MREEYTGREVAVSAISMLYDELQKTSSGRQALAEVSPAAQRISWAQFCALLELAVENGASAWELGAAAVNSAGHKFQRRSKIARRLLTLEDALRFILHPRNPIDFACIHPALSHEPGRVDVVAYVYERYPESETFFTVLLGAAQAFMKMINLPDGQITMQTDGRQAHFVFTYTVGNRFLERAHRSFSARLYGLYSLLLIRSTYPELIYSRKLFETQLIERAKIEAKLTQSERAFEQRMERTNDIIAEWAADAELVYVSPNLSRVMGIPADEVLEGPQKAMQPEDFARMRSAILAALYDGFPQRVDDFRLLDDLGEARWFEANLTPLETAEGGRRVLGVIRDVTERRRFSAERQTLDRQLEHTQRLEMVGVLAGGIAHDFNNLLMPILGFAELADLEAEDPAQVRKRLDAILEAANKASDLVKQLMTYAGTEPAEFVTVDIVEETKSLRELFEASIPANIEVLMTLEDAALVKGDASQLRQVIMNLLINAADAIGDAVGTIALKVQRQDGFIMLTVEDDGCGMDAATRERAFEPFYTTKFTGRGLGLSAVLGIVRAHDGELAVDSEPGQGTCIQMRLRAIDGSVVDVVLPPPVTNNAYGCVLLVDDDARVRDVGKTMLEALGYEVELATDGIEALDALDKQDFTAVVLDLVMPRMDGREVLTSLRQHHEQLPVVLVSGYSATQIGNGIVNDTYTRFLSKPFRSAEIASALHGMIQNGVKQTA